MEAGRSQARQSRPPKAGEFGVPSPRPGRFRGYYVENRALVRGVVAMLLVALVWEVVTRTVMKGSLAIAPITDIVAEYVNLAQSGALWLHIRTSGLEFLIGFAMAMLVGLGVGLVMGVNSLVRDSLDPLVGALYATPVIALAPLFIIWFGIGIGSKIAVVFLLGVLPIIINTETGIRTVDKAYLETAKAFNANQGQVFRKVLFPAALPSIVTGLRLGVGRGLLGVVAGELFAARAGLGQLIVASSQSFNPAGVFVGISALAFSGIALMLGLKALERKLAPWREESSV